MYFMRSVHRSCFGTMEQVRATEGTLNTLNFNDKKVHRPREIREATEASFLPMRQNLFYF